MRPLVLSLLLAVVLAPPIAGATTAESGAYCEVGSSQCLGTAGAGPSYAFRDSGGALVSSGLVTIHAVPEPATALVLAAAGLALAVRRGARTSRGR